jgi:hypothetical protein
MFLEKKVAIKKDSRTFAPIDPLRRDILRHTLSNNLEGVYFLINMMKNVVFQINVRLRE